MNGCVASTPVSSSATVTPAPSKPGRRTRSARCPEPRAKVGLSSLGGERRREGGADRVHALDVAVALEQGQCAAVDRSGEAVERARVDEVRLERDPLPREPRSDLLLAGEGGCGPAALVVLGGAPACLRDPVGRRAVEHDDHPLADRDRAALAVDEAAPARRARIGGRPRHLGASAAGRREQGGDDGECRHEQQAVRPAIRVEIKETRIGRRLPYRPADAIIAALSVHKGSGAKRASGSAARNSEFAATPPTTAIVASPSRSAAACVRSTSARTIARWYEAARSAFRRSASSPRSRTL